MLFRLFPVLLLCFIASCYKLPQSYQTKDEIVSVGPGAEDMIVDTLSGEPRILISCNERRKNTPHYGEVNVYYPLSGAVKILKRSGEPQGLVFNPHGIDLVKVGEDVILLVVNHEKETKINSIIRYKVDKDQLVFVNKITDRLITSPNAVAGFSNGTLLISNDSKKSGSVAELLFKIPKAQIVFWNGDTCSVAAEKFCYSNGITIKNNRQVYLASTRQNKVWQFDFDKGKMINQQVLSKKTKGADNIRFDGNDLLVPCHLRLIKFLKHVKDSTNHSPSVVYRINPTTKTQTVAYYDSGQQLSAASTALVFQNYLYVSGVFDAKLVRKKLIDTTP